MTQATFVLLAISAALFSYRLCAGPSLADRVIALNGLVLVGMGGIATHAAHTAVVAEVNALLYSPHHPRDQLERALRIPALSPGWRWSFEAVDAKPGCPPRRDGQRGSGAGSGCADGSARVSAAASFADRS